MGDPKFSTFIVALIFVSAVAAIFALLMSEMMTNYDVTYTGNESLSVMNKLGELNKSITEYKDNTIGAVDENKNILEKIQDLTGAVFMSGINTVKTVFSSFDIFNSMATEGLNRMGLGITEDIIRTAIISSILVIIVLGIILSAIVKREM